MNDISTPQQEQPTQDSITSTPPRGHTRRPPLAEIDSWELWQAWKRGERKKALPWLGLLTGFCMILAGMYAFFFFSTSLSNDVIAQVGLTIALFIFLFVLWRRISPRRDFALAVVGLIVGVSGAAFLLWLLAYRLSGWNPMIAVLGTLFLGISGILVGLPALNKIASQQQSDQQTE
jgi:hypothetical protein